ncbi:GntP family permease [Erysipelothrix sp. HDW6C]|uniref:GntP family permease n=1 Tax=Erysipelothrix sp. HDW6C TaxID=2714930 RepID=UPI00140C9DE0|nr:SLC13 family permease [Erysipelothrix sp. HDW6C]QIK70308.1 GntP family permease [Erysipelothrix sp. HDW6C]
MEGTTISWIGAIVGLAIAIILIFKKLNPVYSLFLGAIIGALIGGANLPGVVSMITSGTQSIMGTVIRVIAAGLLAGVMMESGAAESIAKTIVNKMGESQAILALALATMIITAVGVFIPVAVLIVAPIALSVGDKIGISKTALLLALSGGGKAGNVISPNPNTIAAAKGFGLELSDLMIADFIPAVVGLIVTVIIANVIRNKGDKIAKEDIDDVNEIDTKEYPRFGRAIVGPLVAVILLLINPIGSILNIDALKAFNVDAMFILPLAAIVGTIAMGKTKHLLHYANTGLKKMTDTVLILIGAGAIAGLISSSDLSVQVVKVIETMGISGTLLAPISGILMGAATGSTSTAVIVATESFGQAILDMGVTPTAAAAMVHTGATVLDQVPQGNYFHVTASGMKMTIKQRLKVLPYEALVGGSMALTATILYGFIF